MKTNKKPTQSTNNTEIRVENTAELTESEMMAIVGGVNLDIKLDTDEFVLLDEKDILAVVS